MGCSLDSFSPPDQAILRAWGDRLCRYCAQTGEVRWESFAWESVRSDSHQLAVKVGSSEIWIQGSPARAMGDGCAVFGEQGRALDLIACVSAMAAHVGAVLGVSMPKHPAAWRVTRIDVTGNLVLGSVTEVKQALTYLRDCEGGRYRVSQVQGDTVYWSQRSRLKAGKAYAKGPQLRKQMQRPGYDGRKYSPEELEAADRLLRLELRLGAQFWRERSGVSWWAADADYLVGIWEEYFGRMLGEVEVFDVEELKERVLKTAPTEGQGRSAYGTWLMIDSQGWERARSAHSSRTWYRNLKILRESGLGDADLAAGQVVPLRRPKLLECRLVNSWDELRKVV